MAARMGTPSKTCEKLLSKLKKGQKTLRSTIQNIKAPMKTTIATQKMLYERKVGNRYRDSLCIDLNSVSKLPRKRARLLQLTPEHEVSPRKPPVKYPRRLSSTPKGAPVDQQIGNKPLLTSSPSPNPLPNVDLSLEEALLKSNDQKKSPSPLPSPKLSRILADKENMPKTTFSSPKMHVDTSQRQSPRPMTSSLKRKCQNGGSKRGLTVSFVQNETQDSTCESNRAGASTNTKKFVRHATQRNLDTSLIDSLNSSRYGAMERHYSQTRKEGKLPRRTAGNDVQLGYDWIAGLLDSSESYLSERDDEYFKDLREFRRVNYNECHRPKEVLLPMSAEREEDVSNWDDNDGSDDNSLTCVSSYMLNDRLFPIHLSSVEHAPGMVCPACEDRPANTHSTRYIRMSVPHSVLEAEPQFKPHRRRSFDSSDSMGLTKHCLAGWETAQPSTIPPQPTMDLKSSLPKEQPYARKTNGNERGRNLLDTSHAIEYSLLSRASTDS